MSSNQFLQKIDLNSQVSSDFKRTIGGDTFLDIRKQGTPISHHPFYWSLKGSTGLVEIGLSRDGLILSLFIPSYIQEPNKLKLPKGQRAQIKKGMPKFSTNLWKIPNNPYDVGNYFTEVQGNFEISIDYSSFRISFLRSHIQELVEIQEGLKCEFDSNNFLISVLIENLNSEEVTSLQSYLERF